MASPNCCQEDSRRGKVVRTLALQCVTTARHVAVAQSVGTSGSQPGEYGVDVHARSGTHFSRGACSTPVFDTGEVPRAPGARAGSLPTRVPRERWGFPSDLGGVSLNTRICMYLVCIWMYLSKYAY